MNQENWHIVQQHFADAIQLPHSKRGDLLCKLKSENPEIAAEVESLLSSFDASKGFLDNEHAEEIASSVDAFVSNISSMPNDSGTKPENGKTKIADYSDENSRNENYLIQVIETAEPDLRVKSVLGYGGLGVVFRARQISLNRDVAVKILCSENPDKRVRARFIRETELAAQLNHDHIVRVFSVNNSGATPFLVMEMVDGVSLSKLIETHFQLPHDLAVELALQVASGLSAAYHKKLIHRDIKPANVLISVVGKYPALGNRFNFDLERRVKMQAKIADFGLAIDQSDTSVYSQDKITAGTPAYMSPEQLFEPETVDHRADVYSLGVTLYQMLSGTTPFKGSLMAVMRQIETQDATRLRKLDERIPKDLESICSKAMQKDRNKRYQSTEEFAQDLLRFKEGHPVQARPITRSALMWNWCKRNRRAAMFGFVAVLSLLVLLVGSLVFAFIVDAKNRAITQEQFRTFESQSQQIIHADPGALIVAVDSIEPAGKPTVVESLRGCFEDSDRDFNQRYNAALALSILRDLKTDYLIKHLNQVFLSPARCNAIVQSLSLDPDSSSLLVDDFKQTNNVRQKAMRAILLLYLGQPKMFVEAVNNEKDPNLRTEIIDVFPQWHANLEILADQIDTYKSSRWIWVICQALGKVDRRSLQEEEIDAMYQWLRAVHEETEHYVVYTNSERAIVQWNLPLTFQFKEPNKRDWLTNTLGMSLIRIDPGDHFLGVFTPNSMVQGYAQHPVTLTYAFYISDTETTNKQFRRYVKSLRDENGDQPAKFKKWEEVDAIVEFPLHPVTNVSWLDAIKFCNWLSKSEGLQPAYRKADEPLVIQFNDGTKLNVPNWHCDFKANGYRLPTEAEWEIACRSGSQTEFAYGKREDLLSEYAVNSHRKLRKTEPVGSLLSNANGLYDCEGNVWEWCHDWNGPVGTETLVDPIGPPEPDPNNSTRVYRGGGVGTMQGGTSADARGRAVPTAEFDNLGFRVVRIVSE